MKNNPEAITAEKKLKNQKTDKEQFSQYSEVLGDKSPKTFSEFQNIKYTDKQEYGILKAQYRGVGYYDKALSKEPEITEQVKAVAEQSGMEVNGLDKRIKAKDTYLDKIRRKYDPDGNEYEVNDILRYTYTAPASTVVEKSLKSIELHSKVGYNTIGVKNHWLNKMNPYNGINTTLRAPNGQAFELQYHTTESVAIKNGKMHDLYEKQRFIKDKYSEEFIKIDDEMFDLSDTLEVPKGIERVKNYG